MDQKNGTTFHNLTFKVMMQPLLYSIPQMQVTRCRLYLEERIMKYMNMNISGRYTISETAFRRYTDAYINIIFKIPCFQYFIILLGFYLPGISKCCYVYYSIPNLYFSISLLSNERVPQFNLLIQSMQSSLLLTCIYFSYYIVHLIVVFLVIFQSCSTYYHYLI